jgi:alpha/beta superfamily hydrolase
MGRPVTERPLTIGRPPRALAAHLEAPDGPVRGGAVVCHPHPQYGGDMDNPVVVAVARALARDGVAALRFDFGEFSGGTAEVADARTALDALGRELPSGTPLALVGYSFGAWVALRAAHEGAPVEHVVAVGPPLAFLDWAFLGALRRRATFVVGDHDQFCDRARLGRVPGGIARHVLVGADHFLAGREGEVAAVVVAELRTLGSPPPAS